MPRRCEVIETSDGLRMIVCSSGQSKPQKCTYCDRPSVALCDWPIGDGKTCDKPLCRIHAVKPIPTFGKPDTDDIDYCPDHYHLYKKDMLEIKYD